jgi:hypothetical protein
LAFLWWSVRLLSKQTQLARESTVELIKQTRLSTWIAASARYSELNDWALRDDYILGLLEGGTRASIYAEHVFNTFNMLHLMHDAGALVTDEWNADVRTLILAFQRDAFLREHWNPDTKKQYREAFCTFIDNEVLPRVTSPEPQAAQAEHSPMPHSP